LAEAPSSSWRIEPFDRSGHDRKGFDCGVDALNDWLQKRVSQFEKRDLSRTYVLVRKDEAVVRGYYAISSHSVSFSALPEDEAQGLPSSVNIPVVLLGKLAVDKSVRGQGLGELLLMDALRKANILSTQLGIRAVEVDAIDSAARRFYLKYGFVPLKDDPNHLFLPMQVIRRLAL
jgi:GNAT superfamily N-acetyltransferase